MNDKVKKFLKYLGVAFLGAVIGCSTLIAVSSCNAKTQTQVKEAGASEEKIIPPSFTTYFDKLYEVNTGVIGLDYGPFKTRPFDESIACEGACYLTGGSDFEGYYFVSEIVFDFSSATGTVSLGYNTYLESVTFTLFWNDQTEDFILTDEYYMELIIYDVLYVSSRSSYDICFYCLDMVEKPIKTSGIFDTMINPYAYFGFEPGTSYIPKVYTGLTYPNFYIWTEPFLSNNQLFNYIQIHFTDLYGKYYLNSEGTWTYCSQQNLAVYCDKIIYGLCNEFNFTSWHPTGLVDSVVVANANLGMFSTLSPDAVGVQSNYNWVNHNYERIYSWSDVNNLQSFCDTYNGRFVYTEYNGATTTTGTVALQSVFTLLSSAFASWIPVLAIEVIPGFTLGMLLFIPLIVNIIILIIWLIKR